METLIEDEKSVIFNSDQERAEQNSDNCDPAVRSFCGFEQNEYVPIPVEVVLGEQNKTSLTKQDEILVTTHLNRNKTQNSSKDTLITKTYDCIFCYFKSSTLEIFKSHLREHSEEKTLNCKFCDYKAIQKSNLIRHERTHSKQYHCSLCDYKSFKSSEVKFHERTHSGEKPFQCSFCDYKSFRSADVKVHEKTHTRENLFQCSFCDYKSCRSSTVKAHERTHSGEKPFHCSFCDYKSTRSSNVKVHERTHSNANRNKLP